MQDKESSQEEDNRRTVEPSRQNTSQSKRSKMADVELERLKLKRSAAQTAFTKRANHLISRANALGETELRGEWRNLKVEHTRVTDAGFDYATALREEDGEDDKEKAEQVDGKTAQCNVKLDETEQILRASFWTRFAEEAFISLVEEAELAMDEAEGTDHQKMNKRERELVNRNLERDIYEVTNVVNEWMDYIPRPNLKQSRDRTRKLKRRHERLWDKWAWNQEDGEDDKEKRMRKNGRSQMLKPVSRGKDDSPSYL